MTERHTVRALRGATTADEQGAAADRPPAATQELLRALLERNGLTVDAVISALFTLTPDLQAAAPALAAREAGWHDVPMLTATEAPAAQSLACCIRVLLHVETARPRAELRHVYLRGARVLRPDLLGDDGAAGH